MRPVRILMVEDDVHILQINREHLEGQGFETRSAHSIAEARTAFLWAPDLVLLDVMLPDGMGWDFAAEIRQHTTAPILYLTCRDEHESVVKGLMRDGDDYITKPYDLSILSARIMAALRRAGFALAGIIDFPPLRVDLLLGKAILDGAVISLTQKEAQLLGCLAIGAGRSLTCEEIYRRAWGEPVGNYERTIAVYVSYLRQKLRLAESGLFEIRPTGDAGYIFSKTKY